MSVALQLKGLEGVLKKFSELPDEIKQAVDDELTATAYEVQDGASLLAPVDLGALKNSIAVTRNEPLLKQISAQVKYAAYVEFGTGTFVSVGNAPPGLQEYALQFKGKGIRKVNLLARPYFFPAFNAATAELVKRLKAIIEETAVS